MRLWRHAIRYPTDLSLLHEAREITEKIIDALYPHTGLKKKPRTYRRQARKVFLGFGILGNCSCIALLSYIHVAMRRSTSCVHAVVGLVKQRRPKKQALRRALKPPLHDVRRNIGHIEGLMAYWSMGTRFPLSHRLLYRYWVVQHVYEPQWEMYRKRHRLSDVW